MAALVEGWRVEKRALLSLFVPWHTVDRQTWFLGGGNSWKGDGGIEKREGGRKRWR